MIEKLERWIEEKSTQVVAYKKYLEVQGIPSNADRSALTAYAIEQLRMFNAGFCAAIETVKEFLKEEDLSKLSKECLNDSVQGVAEDSTVGK